jgi:hypothetical protein
MITEHFQFFSVLPFQGLFSATTGGLAPPHAQLGWEPVSWASTQATLHRADRNKEVVRSIRSALQTEFLPVVNGLLSKVSQALGGFITLTLVDGPFAQIALWTQVPYWPQHAAAHALDAQLLRIDVDLHAATPWPISDADINLSYYIDIGLDAAGHVQAKVDGTWVVVNGGFPITDLIAKGFGAEAAAQEAVLNQHLTAMLKPFASTAFKALYLIPGDGSEGVVAGLANVDTALAVALP